MATLPISTGSTPRGAKTGIRVRALVTLCQGWAARRHERAALARLDDALLKDIGLDRHAARDEATKPFWID